MSDMCSIAITATQFAVVVPKSIIPEGARAKVTIGDISEDSCTFSIDFGNEGIVGSECSGPEKGTHWQYINQLAHLEGWDGKKRFGKTSAKLVGTKNSFFLTNDEPLKPVKVMAKRSKEQIVKAQSMSDAELVKAIVCACRKVNDLVRREDKRVQFYFKDDGEIRANLISPINL